MSAVSADQVQAPPHGSLEGRLGPLSQVLADHAGQVPVPGFTVRVEDEPYRLTAVLERTAVLEPLWAEAGYTERILRRLDLVLVDPAQLEWRARAVANGWRQHRRRHRNATAVGQVDAPPADAGDEARVVARVPAAFAAERAAEVGVTALPPDREATEQAHPDELSTPIDRLGAELEESRREAGLLKRRVRELEAELQQLRDVERRVCRRVRAALCRAAPIAGAEEKDSHAAA